jgi:hypothetical protein
VDTYIGTVEVQGRGTLHLHMVLWLKDPFTSSCMKELLLCETFQDKMKSFIKANIKADLPGYVGTNMLTIQKQKAVAFSQPSDPRKPCYLELCQESEVKMARTVQVHQCGLGYMKVTKSCVACKHCTPFVLSDHDWVNSDGQCGPKRTYSYFNKWCPVTLQCIRANHDIKLILNGMETKDIAWYITNYVAKKQKNSSNTSALLAKTLAFHQQDKDTTQDLRI